ncbi:hypothetical protein ASJ33_07865 [Dehalococcoides mccartyi]|uniref:VTC domain-containing protein n=1 Tax=Dehalococcoides mccartyi TaxID=61435 RepID=UPI0009094E39|nr:VTC domain-containing protein [Dehalococcoides mccartyi]APH13076.1 hypothetical protein ASJ33_07865 [Dehalococcoides mccartyi]
MSLTDKSGVSALSRSTRQRQNITQFQPRIERKFYLSPAKVRMAYGLLRTVALPHPGYASEQINSLYYDTAGLDLFERSISGDYQKDKIRLRWYGDSVWPEADCPAYLELKMRRGFEGSKKRVEAKLNIPQPGRLPDSEGLISRKLLYDTLGDFGWDINAPLYPVISISYWRYRFIEVSTGLSLALDCHIRSTVVAAGLGYKEHNLEMEGGVLEIKGRDMELPSSLNPLRILDIDWSRFSKYAACLEAHQQKPGSQSRLLPSGLLDQSE